MAYIGRDLQYGVLDKQSFTANSSTTVFTLNSGVQNAKSLLVSVGAVIQEPDVAYTASGTTLTFTSAPTTGDAVYVIYLGKELASASGRDDITVETATSAGATTLALGSSPVNAQAIMVFLNGVTQVPDSDYTVSGSTLTFTTAPDSGMAIMVYHIGKAAAMGVLADNSVTNPKIVTMDAGKLTGSLPSSMAADTTAIDQTIASLGMHVAVADNKASFNLPGVFIDQFESDTGILTETTVDRNTTGEYVSSSQPATPTSSSSSEWNGATSSYTFNGTTITSNTGNVAIRTNDTFTGDCKLEHTVTTANDKMVFGFYEVSEDATFTTNSGRGNMESMTNSWFWRSEGTDAIWYGGSNQTNQAISDGSTIKMERLSGEWKLWVDGSVVYTWSQQSTNTVRIVFSVDGPSASSVYSNVSWTDITDTSTSATGTLISTASTAPSATTEASGVMVYENVGGAATLGTDLKAYFSADNGSNWTEVASYGSTINFNGASKKLVKLGKTTGLTSGTQMKLKAEWANQAPTTTELLVPANGWTGGTSNFTLTEGGADQTASNFCIRTVKTFSGDFTFEASVSWTGNTTGCVGVYDTAEDATFLSSGHERGNMNSMTSSYWADAWYPGSQGNQAYYGGNLVGNTYTPVASGDVIKIERVGTTFKIYIGGNLRHTYSQASSATFRGVISGQDASTNMTNIKYTEPSGAGKETRLHGWAINY